MVKKFFVKFVLIINGFADVIDDQKTIRRIIQNVKQDRRFSDASWRNEQSIAAGLQNPENISRDFMPKKEV
jgi:hypothetical protein